MFKVKINIMAVYIILALLMFFAVNCSQGKKQTLIKQGNDMAAKIETYKGKKGRLPDSLTEVGIEEKLEGPIFYEKKSDTEYRLWFGSELGESVVYNSSTRKWE